MTLDELHESVERSFANDNKLDQREHDEILTYAWYTASTSSAGAGIEEEEIKAATALLEGSKRELSKVQGQARELEGEIAQLEQQRQIAAQSMYVPPYQGQFFGSYNPAVQMLQNAVAQRQATKGIEEEIEVRRKTVVEAKNAMAEWQARIQAYTVIEQSFRQTRK
ncbi:MAG: hypothetical protein H7Z43_14675 [Clostridia bacterium]|nr:hypothetical protein [Deltaproteobacteria bacterium]